jgi:hypothetical protein
VFRDNHSYRSQQHKNKFSSLQWNNLVIHPGLSLVLEKPSSNEKSAVRNNFTCQVQVQVQVQVILRPTVSRSVRLGVGDFNFLIRQLLSFFFMYCALSDERTGL